MPDLELYLLALTAAGLVLGGWGVLWARSTTVPHRSAWGRSLFVTTMLILGISSIIAAANQADGLAPLGLVAGSLTVAMLWENPRSAGRDPEPLAWPDQV